MPVDPKWLEILKASTWQTLAITCSCIIIFISVHLGYLPQLSDFIKIAVAIIGISCGCLSIAGMLSAFFKFFPIQRWLVYKWSLRQAKINTERYIPHMQDTERNIISYLLHHNQKMFTGDVDGGYASTLISRGIIVSGLRPGQVFNPTDMPFMIPDHIWDALKKHQDQFPYAPNHDGPYPWRVPWMVR